MRHRKITPESIVEAGEYLFYEPNQQIVLCASFSSTEGLIRAFMSGRLLEDKIENFKKIELTAAEQADDFDYRCKGCKGR